MFEKKYEIIVGAPKAVSWDEYYKNALEEYLTLLSTCGNDEKVFQKFFEDNPAFMPGAFELIGESGHYPFPLALISQPNIGDLGFKRIPDFIWLAQDSLHFCPVLIEIEKPNKKTFTAQGIQTADFSQALNQIYEWKTILNQPENILNFYKYFNIPMEMREKKFSPQYGLIYGRRSEYTGNNDLTRKRAELVPDDVVLISYDRIITTASPKYEDLMCCKLSNRKYQVLTVPPTFRYGPHLVCDLLNVNGFTDAVSDIKMVTEERKKFLKERYSYWMDYASLKQQGIIHTSDRE